MVAVWVVPSAIKEEAVDVKTVLRRLCELLRVVHVQNAELERQRINRDLILASIALQGASQETLHSVED